MPSLELTPTVRDEDLVAAARIGHALRDGGWYTEATIALLVAALPPAEIARVLPRMVHAGILQCESATTPPHYRLSP